MRAAVAEGVGRPLEIEDLRIDSLAPGDVIVDLDASGLCHSDLNPLEGRSPAPGWPLVTGHEGTGTVLEVGAHVDRLRVGDRVIGTFVPACGDCRWCLDGQTHLCQAFYAAPTSRLSRANGTPVFAWTGLGAFAEQMVVSQRSLVKVETDLPPEQVALIGCGVTTGVCAVLNTARVTPGSSVVVMGAGGVGQSVVQGARISGASVIVAVDPVESKRAVALQLGATHAFAPDEAEERVKDLTAGDGVDYAFEVAGRADTAGSGFAMLRRGATLTLVGATKAGDKPPWDLKEWMISEKRVIGSLYGSAQSQRDFPRLLRLAEAGQLRLKEMVSRLLTLDEINDGLAAIDRGEVIRSVIVF